MLHAATNFAEALNDPKRAERMAELKQQLDASIEEIVQHQHLLKRKLCDQLEDLARRRSELDELERSCIREMLAADVEQRAEVGSAFESFLSGSHQASNSCTCKRTPSFTAAKSDLETEEDSEDDEKGMLQFSFFVHSKARFPSV